MANAPVLLILLLLSAATAFASDLKVESVEVTPSDLLIESLTKNFSAARRIQILHTPLKKMGPSGFNREMAKKFWKYKFEFKCKSSCIYEKGFIFKYLSTGLLAEPHCGDIIESVITILSKNGKELLVAYVDASGHCFTIAEKVYITKQSFSDFFGTEKTKW